MEELYYARIRNKQGTTNDSRTAFVLNKRSYIHEVNDAKVTITHEHDGRTIECVAIDGAYVITCNVARNTTTQRKTLQGAVNIIKKRIG